MTHILDFLRWCYKLKENIICVYITLVFIITKETVECILSQFVPDDTVPGMPIYPTLPE